MVRYLSAAAWRTCRKVKNDAEPDARKINESLVPQRYLEFYHTFFTVSGSTVTACRKCDNYFCFCFFFPRAWRFEVLIFS